MKKFTPYIKGLIITGVLFSVLTALNFILHLSAPLAAVTCVIAYICFQAAASAPEHEKYKP